MTKDSDEKDARTVSVHLPIALIDKLDKIVEEGHYASRSDLIRDAIREWIELREQKVGEVERNFKLKKKG